MTRFFYAIVAWLKARIDKIHYSNNFKASREALIRTTFPGSDKVGAYDGISHYLRVMSPGEVHELVRFIMVYYWGEAALLTSKGDYEKLKTLEGLSQLAESIAAYHSEAILNNNSD